MILNVLKLTRNNTTNCQVVRVGFGRSEIVLVDTPSFDDTKR